MAGFYSNLDLFLHLYNSGDMKNTDKLYQEIVNRVGQEISSMDLDIVKSFATKFLSRLNTKWIAASRNRKTFINRNNSWLQSKVSCPKCHSLDLEMVFGEPTEDTCSEDENVSVPSTSSVSTSTEVQPRRAFSDLGNKQKKRRTASWSEKSEEELAYLIVEARKKNGKADLASIIHQLMADPTKVVAVKSFLTGGTKPTAFHEDKALALSTSLKLSRWQYSTLRTTLSEKKTSALPSYKKVLEAKKKCYPPNDQVEVTEDGARIMLQSLADLTVQRLLLTIDPDIPQKQLKLIYKCGFDGASSQSNYKQKTQVTLDDSSVFMTSLVPLKLLNADVIVWENPRPSSTSYCRPVKFQFIKESKEHIQKEEASLMEEIRNLSATQYGDFEVTHEVHFTMIDGKVSTAVINTPSAATCNICLAKPSEMNNLELIRSKPLQEDVYKYGLSTLHMWIRCMEYLLHVAYNLDFKLWTARDENKNVKESRKKAIQEAFKAEMGLLIDIVKQGFGTTNDGNTARRFFRNFSKTAKILNIEEQLIKRFSVILQAISSGEAIKIEDFRTYTSETAEMCIHLYPWYNMPASVHKLLIHGADICKHFSILPIGVLSEEAGEARNKKFRNVREYHSRKIGRIQSNEDILHNFLISSDPYITHLRPKFRKSTKFEMLEEALELLDHEDIENEEDEKEIMPLDTEEIQDPLM